VDCAELQHSHDIAKLIGSPPGYLGHLETHPLITQGALAQHHREKLSFLQFGQHEVRRGGCNDREGVGGKNGEYTP